MIVAVDTGGTKTLVTLFSKDGVAGKMIRFPTPRKKTEYLSILRKTLHENYGGQRIEAIVIALPATVIDGVASWFGNLQGWKNLDIVKELDGVLGHTPIFVENDANLAGLAETRSRTPMPKSSLYVTISTGIGTGITTNGKIDPGLRLSEGGQMPVEYQSKIQTWESMASGKAIYTIYNKYARDIHDKKTWDEIADRISRGFLVAIPLLQPEIIIIGGTIGTYFNEYSGQLKSILNEKLPDHIPLPKLVSAKHPEEAVIYGFYYYALDSLDTQ
ncbi:ROK family protein [Candidatus Saccharibacteria bacterium]|nr:ROK family protein [Candidatus Saccharibacteria bacterium]